LKNFRDLDADVDVRDRREFGEGRGRVRATEGDGRVRRGRASYEELTDFWNLGEVFDALEAEASRLRASLGEGRVRCTFAKNDTVLAFTPASSFCFGRPPRASFEGPTKKMS